MLNFLYKEGSANFPRLATDKLFVDYENRYEYNGRISDSYAFVMEHQLKRGEVWRRFANQFREQSDGKSGWRGEYWGKMMRGACFVYSYSQDPKLYEILTETLEDILSCQEENGRISSYLPENEFRGWDIWCRKYVLLGMQYFLEISTDEELNKRIIASMCRQVDYLIERIGAKEDGKLPITSASGMWRGLNSSSVLEPVVRLYSITGEQRYLDFATHIVECGGTRIFNVFELAYENKIYPYQYPITKAYEMMSCFEGLLEYYRVTGIERHKVTVINFLDRLLDSDFTVIGGAGCTVEMLDHAKVRQSCRNKGSHAYIQQETCVTVTLMKLLYQVHLLTGDPKYADAFERSLYNAYLGVLNTDRSLGAVHRFLKPDWIPEPLPFDSCSPMVSDKRGNSIDGVQVMSDMHYYGCCACIGAAGIGLVTKMQLLTAKRGFVLNLFNSGSIIARTPSGQEIKIKIDTDYPRTGSVNIDLWLDNPEQFELLIRRPEWSRQTSLTLNGEETEVSEGYICLEREWKRGDKLCLELDMRTEIIRPIAYGSQMVNTEMNYREDYVVTILDEEDPQSQKRLAFRRGPLMLAQENRLGYDVEIPVAIDAKGGDFIETPFADSRDIPFEHMVGVKLPLKNGEHMTVTDYASAGKLWSNESKLSVWMLTE